MKIDLTPDPARADLITGMIARTEQHAQTVPIPAQVVTLSSVTPERVSWLWPGRLPAGKVVVLDGDPSVGKSTLTLDLAARVSTGSPWPDGAACTAGDVLLLSAEDGLADTIAPRLHAAEADLSRIHALTEVPQVDDEGTVRMVPPSLPGDLDHIRAVITKHRVRLMVVDVLMAYLSGRVDSHRDQDIRSVLHRLATLADDTSCTILLIRHLNKAGGSNALYRGGGSIGIVGAARAAYLVARDPDDPERRILATTKCNIAVEPPSLAYRLVDTGHGCARVEWETGTVDHTAASLLRPAEDDDERTERDEAAHWLTGYLEQQGGTAPKADIDKAARAAGIAPATLKRARIRAGVHYESSGFPRRTFWLLPDAVGSQSAQSDQPSEPEPTEPTGDPTGGSDAEICICGTALSTTVQRQRGICNRCWVAGRRSA